MILIYDNGAIDKLQEMLGADSDSDDEDDGTESEETPKKVWFAPSLTTIFSSLFGRLEDLIFFFSEHHFYQLVSPCRLLKRTRRGRTSLPPRPQCLRRQS